MFGITQKNWYKIKKGLEFSTNFRYFSEHQIVTTQKPNEFVVKVISVQDGKVLGELEANRRTGAIEDFDLKQQLKDLHANLLEGKVYEAKGEFTN